MALEKALLARRVAGEAPTTQVFLAIALAKSRPGQCRPQRSTRFPIGSQQHLLRLSAYHLKERMGLFDAVLPPQIALEPKDARNVISFGACFCEGKRGQPIAGTV